MYFLSFDLRLLITTLVSCGHCIVCPSSIYGFWLPLWYLVTIVFSVLLRFTASDYHFGILWPLYCLSFFDLRLLITSLVSCGHCIFCPSSIYGFWLPLWYLVAIVLSVLLRFTASDYHFGILWPLYCLSFFDLRLLITSLVSCGHCIFCPSSIYGFWLPLWYLVAIVLSVLLRFTASDYLFGILWPLYFLSFFDLRLLITTLVSCGHCIVCPSSIYGFWLPLWYLVAIVFSVLLRFTASDYLFGILWPLYCLSIFNLRLLIYTFGILWPLYCLSFFDLRLLIYTFGILWPLYCLSIFNLRLLIYTFGILWPLYCLSIFDLRLLIYTFGILWPLYCLSIFNLRLLIYTFGILWPLYFLSFFDLRLLITSLVSCGHCIVCPSSIYDFWFTPLVSCGHCIVCPSSIYGFWLPLWYLVAIVLSVHLRFTASDYLFGILWPLYFLSFFDLRLLITTLVSCGHCIVCPSSIYGFWLPLWYLVAIVFSVLLRFTASDYLFGILWPLYCLSIFNLRLLIYTFGILWPLYCLSFYDLRLMSTTLVSCGHCIVCPSIYGFWLPLWYLVAIVFSVLLRFTASDYLFGILWTLYCLSFDLRLLITSLVSCGHCIVCPSSIYGFWLPLWYLVAIVLSVLLRFTASDYLFGILWPLYFLSFDLRLLITSLVSCGHCIFCPFSIYGFWLPLWYLVTIVFSVLLRFTASDYLFGILWPLYCLSFDLRLLITSLVSCDHCIFCPSSIYGFWLPLWYLVTIVFSVLLRFTASDYLFGILNFSFSALLYLCLSLTTLGFMKATFFPLSCMLLCLFMFCVLLYLHSKDK